MLQDDSLNLTLFENNGLVSFTNEFLNVIAFYHTNISVSNIDVYSEFSDVNEWNSFLKPIDLEEKGIRLNNMYIEVSGALIYATSHFNINATNLVFNAYQSSMGIRTNGI